jgi:hypothetical protein
LIPSNPLADLWDTSKEESLIKPTQQPRIPVNIPAPTRKTAREEQEDEHAKRRYLESAKLISTVTDHLMTMMKKDPHYSKISTEARELSGTGSDWIKSYPDPSGTKKKVLAIECGTGLCMQNGSYVSNIIIRFAASDFLTENVLIDMDIKLPDGYEPADLRPSFTGIDETQIKQATYTYRDVRNRLLEMMSSETVLITSNPSRCAAALRLDHANWISLTDLFRVDPAKKKAAEGKFHVRQNLTIPQIIHAYLGEQIFERLQSLPCRERLTETLLGSIRLVKAVARQQVKEVPILIDLPRRFNTVLFTHVPADWSASEIHVIVPSAVEVDNVDFFLDPTTNQWRGETHAKFRNEIEMRAAFDKLTACTDVFVGWEWAACGQVDDSTIRSLAEDFGPVVAVRIQDKYLGYRTVLPGKEESRPFGFVSFARYQDAVSMAGEPRQIEKNHVSYHVKISKKPISAFKRIPLGQGEDYIEAFIM